MGNEINFFAQTTFHNQRKKFGIKPDDRRRHVYIVGKTGMGKTVVMENMAIQDIQNGRGIGFIDPHGEASERLLDFVPASRVNDVIYFNPADLDFPIAFNVMERVGFEQRHLVASGLMGVFKKIWPDIWSARMEYILNNSILALLEYPGSTLLAINRMLADPDYRKKVVDKVTDPVVKSFWLNEFARYTQRYEVEATAAIQNKVGQFISAPLIRNIIGQTKTNLDMRDIMDKKKILIANISKGRIGEDNSRLLGALLITKLQLAAMSRVDMPENQRQDFFLYVDEFQNFATKAFVNILSEARKYRLALTIGNQYIAQLIEMTVTGRATDVRDAVFGNVGTIICFRIGAEDAEFLEREFTPEFLAPDLVNLTKYHVYLKLMIDGVAGRPFSAETLPPLPMSEESNKEKIIKVSRERYGTSSKIVEDKISRWLKESLPATAAPSAAAGTILYDAQCSLCRKQTKVVFQPDGRKPIYCKSCRNKLDKDRLPLAKEPERLGFAQKPISLGEAIKKESPVFPVKEKISFPAPINSEKKSRFENQNPEKERIKKTVDIEDLKKTLEEALRKSQEDKEL
ncbi:MAG: CxxC-x17-CxxC domain-containing protein [Patescibacteria group bacterium]